MNTCSTCAHWQNPRAVVGVDVGAVTDGECWLNPPVTIMVGFQRVTAQVTTSARHSCREYKVALPPVPPRTSPVPSAPATASQGSDGGAIPSSGDA